MSEREVAEIMEVLRSIEVAINATAMDLQDLRRLALEDEPLEPRHRGLVARRSPTASTRASTATSTTAGSYSP
jgi:hypothetical protein